MKHSSRFSFLPIRIYNFHLYFNSNIFFQIVPCDNFFSKSSVPTVWGVLYALISKMCYKLFDGYQKWGWYTKQRCKCQCVDDIFLVGFIIFFANIFCNEFGIIYSARWYNFHCLILLIFKNQFSNLTFWTKNETWDKPMFIFIGKKIQSKHPILKIHTIQCIQEPREIGMDEELHCMQSTESREFVQC